jgi:hypothetical protein
VKSPTLYMTKAARYSATIPKAPRACAIRWPTSATSRNGAP